MKGVLPPPSVRMSLPGTLTALADATRISLYVREDNWELRKYPRHCPVELRLGTWDMDPVLVVALMVRLGRNDATTFDHLLDVSLPENVRLLQCLAEQSRVEVHLATDIIVRSFRVPNAVRTQAAGVVHALRQRAAWSENEFQRASKRLTQLYPTSDRLWWACDKSSA